MPRQWKRTMSTEQPSENGENNMVNNFRFDNGETVKLVGCQDKTYRVIKSHYNQFVDENFVTVETKDGIIFTVEECVFEKIKDIYLQVVQEQIELKNSI